MKFSFPWPCLVSSACLSLGSPLPTKENLLSDTADLLFTNLLSPSPETYLGLNDSLASKSFGLNDSLASKSFFLFITGTQVLWKFEWLSLPWVCLYMALAEDIARFSLSVEGSWRDLTFTSSDEWDFPIPHPLCLSCRSMLSVEHALLSILAKSGGFSTMVWLWLEGKRWEGWNSFPLKLFCTSVSSVESLLFNISSGLLYSTTEGSLSWRTLMAVEMGWNFSPLCNLGPVPIATEWSALS